MRKTQTMRSGSIAFAVCWAVLLVGPGQLLAQPFQRGGAEFNAMREVALAPDKDFGIAVVEFLHHGQVAADGKNVAVTTKDDKLVPTRVLQVGPGDFCRVAFETVKGQKNYELYYGGQAPKNPPAWKNPDGLLLETRKYKDCNVNKFESVREAFHSSTLIGSDYVPAVLHANNPFSPRPEPFLSRYSGTLHVATGTYGFLVSSQDCGFLVIDDKVVAAAPGVHGPRYDAPPGSRKDIPLTAGPHKFEFYHAATGPAAMMIVAWEPSPAQEKPKPQAIPPECFHVATVGRAQAGPPTTRAAKLVPDFTFTTTGDVPLPENDMPLVAVKFVDTSPAALTSKSKIQWDFGDGQTSESPDPTHVYLHPGVYKVTLTVKRGGKPFAMTNAIYVDRPFLARHDESKAPKLDDFLPILASYNPRTLDAAGLKQLVAAYQWKIDTIITPDATPQKKQAGEEAKDSAESKQQEEAKKAEIRKYEELAVSAGKAALVEEGSGAKGDEDLFGLAKLVGPMARDRLGDATLAARLWMGAVKRIAKPDLKAQCEIEAADIALNDLGNPAAAKELLDAATSRLAKDAKGPVAGRLRRVWGDYYASEGKGEEACKAYREAQMRLESPQTNTEQIAWQGAHSRSTEQFLKSNELDRAAAELRAWQDAFPADKIDGYVALLFARYWAAREMYPQAIALSEQLLAVNPASPYVDQILVLAAECEVKRGQADRALATLHALVKDYPGSPLVPAVRKRIQALESGETEPPKKPAVKKKRGE